MENSFIQFENVKKIYQAGQVQVTALHDVSFTIEKGEICVIVGESGAGKTTLLNILGGMDSLTEGRILVDGEDISQYDKRRLTGYRRSDVGFVFQFYNLIPNLTALENVEIAAKLSADALDAAAVLEQVGLKDRMKNFPAQLSGGEQQRVAIARSLCSGAPVILADEPTGNLDGENTRIVMEILRRLAHEENRCVIVVTHDPEVADTADLVLRMKDGTLTMRQ